MTASVYYENDTTLAQYCEFHFGEQWHGEANFPKALADLAVQAMGEQARARALDIGCAVGRSSFELARTFERVDGVDFSHAFIRTAAQMATEKCLRYARPEEGELVSYHERTLEELGLANVVDRVQFQQGDACQLAAAFTGYDLVLAANLIDRLYDPGLFLDSIQSRINAGGVLAIASPYTWLEEYTPKDKWLGGFQRDGQPVHTLDGLREHLSADFTLLQAPVRVPFVIRETRNKFQHSFSELSFWQKSPGR